MGVRTPAWVLEGNTAKSIISKSVGNGFSVSQSGIFGSFMDVLFEMGESLWAFWNSVFGFDNNLKKLTEV